MSYEDIPSVPNANNLGNASRLPSVSDPTANLSGSTNLGSTARPIYNTGASELSRMHGTEGSQPHFGRSSFKDSSMMEDDDDAFDGKRSSVIVRVVKNSESKAAEAQQKQKEHILERGKSMASGSTHPSTNGMPRDTLNVDSNKKGGASPAQPVAPTPLLPPDSDEVWAHGRKIYGSFFFAAWGARMWEFAAILFILDGLFPDSLMASSLFGLFEALSGLCGSGLAGHIVDRKDRLYAIRLAILVQNASVVAAMCILTLALVSGGPDMPIGVRVGFLICVIVFGITAKFGEMLDKMCINKDWTVVIAGGNRGVQSHLNAVVRRIDMICQVGAPFLVGICSVTLGAAATCVVVGAWALLSTPLELYLSGRVYHSVAALSVPRNILSANPNAFPMVPNISVTDEGGSKSVSLQRTTRPITSANSSKSHTPKNRADENDEGLGDTQREMNLIVSGGQIVQPSNGAENASQQLTAGSSGRPGVSPSPIGVSSTTTSVNDSISVKFDVDPDEGNSDGCCGSVVRKITGYVRRTMKSWSIYRAHPCFWISIPYALLYVSVLGFGGIMVAYLKTIGCSDYMLAVGRGLSALVAVFPTFVVPYMIPRKGLYKTGEYMMFAQVLCLVPLAIAFLAGIGDSSTKTTTIITVNTTSGTTDTETVTTKNTPVLLIVIIFFSVCASRFGLWGFDLAQTQMMQELVQKAETGRVNGSQELIVNTCWLLSYLLTVIFHQPEMFKWPAIISFGAISLATLIFTFVGMKTTAIMREQAAATLDYA